MNYRNKISFYVLIAFIGGLMPSMTFSASTMTTVSDEESNVPLFQTDFASEGASYYKLENGLNDLRAAFKKNLQDEMREINDSLRTNIEQGMISQFSLDFYLLEAAKNDDFFDVLKVLGLGAKWDLEDDESEKNAKEIAFDNQGEAFKAFEMYEEAQAKKTEKLAQAAQNQQETVVQDEAQPEVIVQDEQSDVSVDPYGEVPSSDVHVLSEEAQFDNFVIVMEELMSQESISEEMFSKLANNVSQDVKDKYLLYAREHNLSYEAQLISDLGANKNEQPEVVTEPVVESDGFTEYGFQMPKQSPVVEDEQPEVVTEPVVESDGFTEYGFQMPEQSPVVEDEQPEVVTPSPYRNRDWSVHSGGSINELRGVKFETGTSFEGSQLSEHDLSGMDFSSMDMQDVWLTDCKLFGTNFRNANLSFVHLSGAMFDHNTDFRGADLRGASLDLPSIKAITEMAKTDENTQFDPYVAEYYEKFCD